MNRWIASLLAALVIHSLPAQVSAQMRGSIGSGSARPPAGGRPHPGPSQPSPPPTVATLPVRPTIGVSPVPVHPHRLFPVRSSWFGLVLFDPYWWGSGIPDQAPFPAAAAPSSDRRPTGGLQLDVEPRRALVYVDGWFVGLVDEFSGYYHHLDLDAGSHRIDFVASGYDPLSIDAVVSPGRTATYRGSLNRY
jgi:hypothetical protein